MEGSTLTVIFRLFNRITSVWGADRCHYRDPHIYCSTYQQCIGPDGPSSTAVLVTFQPIKLSDNQTYISFVIDKYIPDLVTINGEYHQEVIIKIVFFYELLLSLYNTTISVSQLFKPLFTLQIFHAI